MNNNGRLAWVLKFVRLICPDHLIEEIEGDLIQRLERDIRRLGEKKAQQKLIWNALRFFRPGILLRNRYTLPVIRVYMIANYITIAFRNFRKQRSFTALNIIGLSLGMTASILILQYVKYERSFDTFHARANDIYRMQYNVWHDGKLNFESAVAVPAAGIALKNNFPEVEEITRLFPVGGVVSYENPTRGLVSFHEQKMPYADPSVFKVFDFHVIKGDASTALSAPNKIMLSASTARKYFDDEDPIGKTLTRNKTERFEVTGIFEDVPENSHIQFDFLVSSSSLDALYQDWSTNWGWYDFYVYVLLKPGTDVKALQVKWDAFLANDRKDVWKNSKQEFILRPLTDIHLYSKLLYEAQPDDQRDGDSVYALSVIALFILVIALINYINMATARSFNRANEVGVRKVIGAFRSQLISQFLIESFILFTIACIVALVMVRLLWSPFSSLAGWQIPIEFIYQGDFWKLALALFIGSVVLSGLYPAIILSSFKPVAVLKGKAVPSGQGNFLRKSLVVFQFVASVFLIAGSIIVYQQLDFMKSKNIGINIDHTVVLRGPSVKDSLYDSKYEAFRNEVQRVTGVKSITSSTSIPGDEIYWTAGIRRLSGGPPTAVMVSHAAIDADFVPSFGMKLIAGRNFEPGTKANQGKIIVNRALTKLLEVKDPQSAIGERVFDRGDTVEIIGVMEDYHQMSLKSAIAPMAFWSENTAIYYALKLQTANAKVVMASIEPHWKASFPEAPIDYFFLDEFYNKQYEKDNRFGTVFGLFTGLAIFIASLGLLGLASFVTAQRTKEIGIRKVLGSTVSGIVLLLSKSFMRYVILANLIAWPLTWYVMDQWLQSFSYRISISPVLFVVAGLIVVFIAFVSVSSQTIRAALKQPAKTLKYE